MKKGDVGMAKRFSKMYGNKGWVFNYLQSEIKLCQDSIQAMDIKRPVTSLVKGDLLGTVFLE